MCAPDGCQAGLRCFSADRHSPRAQEIEEHSLAATVLRDYDDTRRCHRAVGGVLLEQTVGDVRPAVENEVAMLVKARSDLDERIRKTEEEIIKFQKENGIRMVSD